MRVLLDTHIFLWAVSDHSRLTDVARGLIQGADEVFVSSASIWEVSIKVAVGKLKVDVADLIAQIGGACFLELPVMAKHARTLSSLPPLHRDPFDRMLVAQAICEPLYLLTSDRKLAQYSDLVRIV